MNYTGRVDGLKGEKMKAPASVIQWLADSEYPWVRRIARDELGAEINEPGLDKAVLESQLIQQIVSILHGDWPLLKGHNKADHPLNLLRMLHELGGSSVAPILTPLLDKIFGRVSPEGLPLTEVIEGRWGSKPGEPWMWYACDAPLYVGVAARIGMIDEHRVRRAAEAILAQSRDNSWGCLSSRSDFRGPGRKDDPCPIAILDALYALAPFKEYADHPTLAKGVDVLLTHAERGYDHKLFMFGAGRKLFRLKYPHAWYDLANLLSVLAMIPAGRSEPRTQKLAERVLEQADDNGFFTPGSIYMAWKGNDFGQKKQPSPTLTARLWTILQRL